ncbi:hypothetical protein HGB24_02420 [Candidatus Saccharibacteria bacterium]|nr:hypothetical protein [Candidatus Saccharibacteria bacterium]
MKFAVASPAKQPKTKETENIAYILAFIFIIMVVCQLFSFDELLPLLSSLSLPGDRPTAYLLGGLIVTGEVLSLPFLLSMAMSQLMRFVSMVFCWFVPAIWIFLSIWQMISNKSADNIGFLGTVVNIRSGWLATLYMLAVMVLSIWASWGMWPLDSRKKKN